MMYYKPDGYTRKQPNTWYITILIFLIPLFIFCTSVNMVTRVADAYQWKMNQNIKIAEEDKKSNVKTLQDLEIFISEETFAGNIADYINGKSDKVLTYDPENELAEYYEARAPKVTDNDYRGLDVIKKLDLGFLLIAIFSFVWMIVVGFLLIRSGYDAKELLRKKLLKSFIFLGILEVLMFIYLGIKPVYTFINGSIFGISYGKKDLLMNLLGSDFPFYMGLFILAISIALSAVIFYVIWVSTKPRDIFNERRYFR